MRGIKNHQRKDQIFIAILHTWTMDRHMTLEIDINLRIKVCNSVFYLFECAVCQLSRSFLDSMASPCDTLLTRDLKEHPKLL